MTGPKLTVAVPAAGRGTRLEPITLKHSKAVTPVLGVPILKRVIDGFREIGLEDFVVVKAPDDAEIDDLCLKLEREGCRIKTAVQEKRLGTAHALLQARDLIETDFVLCSCDNLFSESHLRNLVAWHMEHRPPAVITLEPLVPEKLTSRAAVRLDGSLIVEIKEKPGDEKPADGKSEWDALAKFLFTFDRRLLDYLDRIEPSPRGEFEVQSALDLLMRDSDAPARGLLADNCLHLTSEQDLVDIHKHYLDKHRPFGIHENARVKPDAVISEPVMIEEGARIGAGAIIGPYVYVGKNAVIGNGARVENAVLYPGARVEPGTTVHNRILTDD